MIDRRITKAPKPKTACRYQRLIRVEGECVSIEEAARRCGKDKTTIRNRYNRGSRTWAELKADHQQGKKLTK